MTMYDEYVQECLSLTLLDKTLPGLAWRDEEEQ